MKFLVWCTKCNGFDHLKPYLVAFRDDGKYTLRCDKGHTQEFSLQITRFEVLFEIGLQAILDGYTREAVLSFAACYERFFDFFYRVVTHKFKIPEGEAKETFKSINRAEKQLGAYALAYLLNFKEAPQFLTNKQVTFRNDVAHNGKIPNRDEAISYGQAVFDIVNPSLQRLRQSDKTYFFEELKRQSGTPPRAGIRTMINCGTKISPPPPQNVPDYLAELERLLARHT